MSIQSRPARRAVTTAAAGCAGAFLAALAAACGSQGAPSASPPSSGGTPSSSPAGTPSSSAPGAGSAPMIPASQCPTSALKVTVNKAKGSGAAGTSYVPIDFTNVSSHSCDMYGYPGVSFVSAPGGSQLGDAASRQTSFGPENVTLASGAVAHAWLGIADAGNFSPSACGPVTAHWLKVYPPDQYAALSVQFTAQVCAKKITGGSTPLTILPVRPAAGTPGTVP